jgi:hypothetical protein
MYCTVLVFGPAAEWPGPSPHNRECALIRAHDSEIEQAIEAVTRIREDSELRQRWQASGAEGGRAWRHEIDDLIARLRRSGAGEPATLAP